MFGLSTSIQGTMTLGEEGKNGVRNPGVEEAQGILNVFFNHGHTELDTARMYAEGTTEKVSPATYPLAISPYPTFQQRLSELNLRDATIDTKSVHGSVLATL